MWDRLLTVKQLEFEAKSDNKKIGWNGHGQGSVQARLMDSNTLIYEESGVWQIPNGHKVGFNNVFKWQYNKDHTIALSHLRYGPNQPVFLFLLKAENERHWKSVVPHQCNADQY